MRCARQCTRNRLDAATSRAVSEPSPATQWRRFAPMAGSSGKWACQPLRRTCAPFMPRSCQRLRVDIAGQSSRTIAAEGEDFVYIIGEFADAVVAALDHARM